MAPPPATRPDTATPRAQHLVGARGLQLKFRSIVGLRPEGRSRNYCLAVRRSPATGHERCWALVSRCGDANARPDTESRAECAPASLRLPCGGGAPRRIELQREPS